MKEKRVLFNETPCSFTGKIYVLKKRKYSRIISSVFHVITKAAVKELRGHNTRGFGAESVLRNGAN